jgi:hypothetical protein
MTGNHKVSGLKQAIAKGYRVSFWEIKGRTNISVTKDGKEVAYYVDKDVNNKVVAGTAFTHFADDVVYGRGWFADESDS